MNNVDVSDQAQNKMNAPMSLDITKVKDVNELILKIDELLIEVSIKTSSGLIIPGEAGASSIDKLVIAKIGIGVNTYKVGDIILDVLNPRAVKYMHKKGDEEKRYAITNEYNINLATVADNMEE